MVYVNMGARYYIRLKKGCWLNILSYSYKFGFLLLEFSCYFCHCTMLSLSYHYQSFWHLTHIMYFEQKVSSMAWTSCWAGGGGWGWGGVGGWGWGGVGGWGWGGVGGWGVGGLGVGQYQIRGIRVTKDWYFRLQTMFQHYLEQHPHDFSFIVDQVWIYNLWFTTKFLGQIWWKKDLWVMFSNAKSMTCNLEMKSITAIQNPFYW